MLPTELEREIEVFVFEEGQKRENFNLHCNLLLLI